MLTGETKELSLRVQNYSKEFRSHVSFTVQGSLGAHPVNRDTIVSSRPEDSFEYVVQQAEIQRQKNSSRGLQKLNNGKSLSEKFRADKIYR
jgi:hypothetical protein